jgi:hypothetical protein
VTPLPHVAVIALASPHWRESLNNAFSASTSVRGKKKEQKKDRIEKKKG